MRDLFYFSAGSTIIFVAVLLILAGNPVIVFAGILFSISVSVFIPTKFWKNFWRSNMRLTRNLGM